MKNLGAMMKQAQEMQAKMAEMQERLANTEIEGSSGGGLVRVTLTGKSQVRKVKIDPSLMADGDVEVIEDLVVAAFNDARGKIETMLAEKMSELTGGLPLPPDLQLPF
ncbi:MAG: YbaB/EbfC family nucleoid-associated protein [Rhodospirillales bacterium]